jgi:hypothetical protein
MVTRAFFISLGVAIVTANFAFAETVDALQWHGVQHYDVAALKKVADLQVGKVVGIRCQYRSKRMQRIRASWYEANLWQYNPQDHRKPAEHIRVKFARKDLPAFESLPTDYSGRPATIIYGEVQKDNQSTFVRLIGTKVARDSGRNAIVNW